MLDDLTLIHHRDTQDMLGAVARQTRQLTERLILPTMSLSVSSEARNIVFVGVGCSALAGHMASSLMPTSVPLTVVQEYDLPHYVGPETLCIMASYSGNTEEVLSALDQALKRRARIVVISHGGRLKELAQQASVPFVQLPSVAQPRLATWLVVNATMNCIKQYGLGEGDDTVLDREQSWLAERAVTWAPDVSTSKNEAKRIAQELLAKSIVVGSGPRLWPAAQAWKLVINENAQQVAWTSQYPEASHHELAGWTRQPVHKPYALVELRSSLEHPQVQKRLALAERILSGLRPAPIVVDVQGETLARQLLYATTLGNFVSVYLALLGGIDPSATQVINKIKEGARQ